MGLKFTDRTSCNNCNWFNSKYRHSNFDIRSKVAFGRGLTERSDLKELGTSWLWRSFDLVFKVYKTTTLRNLCECELDFDQNDHNSTQAEHMVPDSACH